MKIIPALLENDMNEISSQITRLSPYFRRFQIDIVDDKSVSNKTVGIDELLGNSDLRTSSLSFDLDLIVDDPGKHLEKLKSFGDQIQINNVFLHLKTIKKKEFAIQDINFAFNVGIAVDPDDSIDLLYSIIDLKNIPAVQVMSVYPGFQGQEFIENMLNKIEQLRVRDYRGDIYLDGGINDASLPKILEKDFKPDFLCIGSFLTKTDKLEERINHLQEVISR